MMHAAFLMEQHLGHTTYSQNLQRFISDSPRMKSFWIPVTYRQPAGLIDRLPFLPEKLRGPLRGRAEVLRGLRTTQADVFFFNTQVPAVLGQRSINRPYVIATDITPIQYDAMGELYNHKPDRIPLLSNYKFRRNVAVFQGAAKLLPWSTWVRDSMISDYGVPADRIEVVPPGVDLGLWQPARRYQGGPLNILFVGGDFHRKGGQTLLEAFRRLPPGSAKLHLVTRTPLEAEQGVFIYSNMQPNSKALLDLYQSSDVFVLASGAEAFGIAAVEASASGMAAIVTAVGGLRDIVVDNETGFSVAPGNVQELFQRLQLLIDSPELRTKMGYAARLRVEQRFDARKNAERVIDAMLEIGQQTANVGVPLTHSARDSA